MNLFRTLVNVSSITLLSRMLGFMRDALIARQFGAGLATDAFFVAFKLPNLLRRLFSEGAFAQAFVPLLSQYRHNASLDETRAFIAGIGAVLGLALGLLTALGMLAAPLLVWLMAPGFSQNSQAFTLTVELLRITLPYILFISLSSLASSILNAWGHFTVPAFTPVILNLTFMAFTLLLATHFTPPVMTLAWATCVGGCLQLIYPLHTLYRLHLLPRPRLDLRNHAAWRAAYRLLPAIFSVSVAQISLLINTTFASFLPTGSVSWMYYADRLMEFPTGVLGAALGTILLPSLSQYAATENHASYSALIDWGIRLTLLLGLPATLGLAMLAGPLTDTLFRYGHFTLLDAAMTRQALMAYALGLVGLILIKVLVPGFLARQNLRTPVRIAILTLLITLVLNALFIVPLRHAGLALSIGLAALLNASLLLYELWRTRIYCPQAGWPAYLMRLSIALIVMALLLWWLPPHLPAWSQQHSSGRITGLGLLIGSAALSYFVALFAFGLRVRHLQSPSLRSTPV